MTDHGQDRFDEAFKKWAERPARISSEEAARRVVSALPARRTGGWWSGPWLRLASAAAALALVLVVGWATWPGPPKGSEPVSEINLPPLQEDVVLLWLDEQTPLYLTVTPPTTKGDSR